jgi:uncharacterized phage-associated protein
LTSPYFKIQRRGGMATASEVSRYIIRYFQEAGDPVTNLKLQKLLYYVQGWSLAIRDQPAFNEPMQAWVHGPVQPAIYGTYKQYRWNPIVEVISDPVIDGDLKDVINQVLQAYGTDSGYELEIRTHQEIPWIQARGDIPSDEESTNTIEQDVMKTFFIGLRDGAK